MDRINVNVNSILTQFINYSKQNFKIANSEIKISHLRQWIIQSIDLTDFENHLKIQISLVIQLCKYLYSTTETNEKCHQLIRSLYEHSIDLGRDCEKLNQYVDSNENHLKKLKNDFNIILDALQRYEENCKTNKFELWISNYITNQKSEVKNLHTDYRFGSIYYDIADEMLLDELYRCIIRISVDKNILIKKSTQTRIVDTIRISDVMVVDLIDTSVKENFLINTICSNEQIIDDNNYTEWLFNVTPLILGKHPLILRVSIIQIINNIERKKQIVFEKEILVKATGIMKKQFGWREFIGSIDIPINHNKDYLRDKINVFISYNHKDKETAYKINNALKLAGLNVIIDSEMTSAGENITNFIEQSILKSDITLSIISNNSLLSSWVGIETINTFYHEKFSDKKFIACYTDDDFFNNKFRITATRKIDEKIKELDNLILECMELKLDTTDLNNEKSRLFQLRNNLGEILQRLRNSLCIDIKENVFENNIKQIISTISG